MKLCANLSLLFTEHPLLDRFAAASDCGFNAVEIQFPYEAPLGELLVRKNDNQLQLPLINVPAGDLMTGGCGLASHPKRRDQFKHAVDECLIYAEALGVERVNVLAGRTDAEFSREQHYDTFLENLNYCADQLKALGVLTVFEAVNTEDMADFLIHNTEHMQQVLHNLNHSNLAMQYDLYHMAKMQQPIAEQLPDIIDNIGHIQFADTPDRHQPGTGDLPFTDLLQQLRNLSYSHWIGAEYKPQGKTAESLEWMELFE